MTNCFLCKGEVSSLPWRAYSKDDLKDDRRILLEGMSHQDKVCSNCFDHHKDVRKKGTSDAGYPAEGEESHYTKKPTSSAISAGDRPVVLMNR